MKRSIAIASLVTLVACSGGGDEPGLTSAEDRQLDEAAAALDEAQQDYESAIQSAQTDEQATAQDEE
jgi:hypothetical protein